MELLAVFLMLVLFKEPVSTVLNSIATMFTGGGNGTN